ncbi:hypothetical protein IWW50_001179 [Coemansia erecta]|nr:hypothetical protein GGF43_003553 [Coemansia sp. RSA 2618]KAJ2828840.1 hypothetical protein IWW50_001179 [Coemansia erecta]
MESTRDYNAISSDVAASLQRLPAGNEFAVRVIHTADYPVESLTPQRRHSHFYAENTLSRRVLILVSQGDCLVAGLEAHEFTSLDLEVDSSRLPHQAIAVNACIEKVDTTGELRSRMPLARMLVAGYVCSLQRYSKALDVASVGLHLFARAQPEYLFAKSQNNPAKNTLSDSALVKWWQRTMQFALHYALTNVSCSISSVAKSASDASNCTELVSDTAIAYCVVPGADIRDAPVVLGTQSGSKLGTTADADGSASPAVEWKWGLPHPAEAVAHNCVLQFPDDPITRLLAEPHTKSWTVNMLLEMLAVGEECGSGHRTAYFSAALPIAAANPRDSPCFEEAADQGTLTFEDYDKMLIALFDREMDFSTTDAAAVSSKRVVEFIDTNFSTPVVLVSTDGPEIAQEAPAAIPAAAPVVNDLSSIIRKKRKVAK